MKSQRRRVAEAGQSPERFLRQASMSLDILRGTIEDMHERLESSKSGVSFLHRAGLIDTIDELFFVADELRGTRHKIEKARIAYKRRDRRKTAARRRN